LEWTGVESLNFVTLWCVLCKETNLLLNLNLCSVFIVSRVGLSHTEAVLTRHCPITKSLGLIEQQVYMGKQRRERESVADAT